MLKQEKKWKAGQKIIQHEIYHGRQENKKGILNVAKITKMHQ